MVAEKRPALTDDEHAHDVESDPDVLGVQVLSEVGRRQPFERRAVRVLLGESLAAVLRDLAVNEEQVVLVAGDEVGYVTAARPVFLQNLEAPALEVDPNALLGLVSMSSLAPGPPWWRALWLACRRGSRGCKGESKTRRARVFARALRTRRKVFAALAAASGSRRAYKSPRRAPGGRQGARGHCPPLDLVVSR